MATDEVTDALGAAPLTAPFPYFGGKRKVAHLVWPRFGDPHNYVEAFAGSLAVLLARPTRPRIETINDVDRYVANFWRAAVAAPEEVVRWADWPVNECDLHARHAWLVSEGRKRLERLVADPDFYDAKVAGWWLWGICLWIGGGWCRYPGWRQRPDLHADGVGVHAELANGAVHAKRPNLDGYARGALKTWQRQPDTHHHGRGVHRKVPYLDRGGRGVHRQVPDLSAHVGRGVFQAGDLATDEAERQELILDWMRALQTRLRRVRVCCGDFERVLGPTPTYLVGLTAVFLDPPYSREHLSSDSYRIYSETPTDVAERARAWAIANGDNPMLRIALCGYEGEHAMPSTWTAVRWKAGGGYGNQGFGRGRANALREVIWFSPHCLSPGAHETQLPLLTEDEV